MTEKKQGGYRGPKKQLGKQVLTSIDTEALIGGNLKWFWGRITRGGTAGYPLGNPLTYKWDRDRDCYILKPVENVPELQLFRRYGEWRIRFEVSNATDVPLFSQEHLNEPVYAPLAIIYAIQTAAYSSLRERAMLAMLQEVS